MKFFSRENSIDMTAGRPLKAIIPFTIPILLANIFQQLYSVVDGIVVGKNVGDEAQAAVGASFSVTYMMTCVFLGIGIGAAVLVGQHAGANDRERIRKSIMSMNSFLILTSLPLTAAAIGSAGFFLNLLHVRADIFDLARTYMIIYYLGMLGQFGYNANAGILQGLGDSRSPLLILAISSILHVILDVLFVAVLHWGVVGVALSTVLSQYFSWGMSIYFIKKNYPELDCRFALIRFDGPVLKELLRIGLPAGIQNALYSVGIMVMQPLINDCGTVFIAGYSAAVKVDGFVFIPCNSLASAATTYVAQNIGAQKPDRVKEGVREIIKLSVGMCAALCLIVIPLRSVLMRMFTDDPAVVAAGNAYLLRVIPFYVISALQYVYIALLRGMGISVIPTAAALLSLWLARVPSAYFLTSRFGADNMHWCYAIGWVMGLAIMAPYYHSGRWKRRTAPQDGPALPGTDAAPKESLLRDDSDLRAGSGAKEAAVSRDLSSLQDSSCKKEDDRLY